jgi:DNA topoisomerase-1
MEQDREERIRAFARQMLSPGFTSLTFADAFSSAVSSPPTATAVDDIPIAALFSGPSRFIDPDPFEAEDDDDEEASDAEPEVISLAAWYRRFLAERASAEESAKADRKQKAASKGRAVKVEPDDSDALTADLPRMRKTRLRLSEEHPVPSAQEMAQGLDVPELAEWWTRYDLDDSKAAFTAASAADGDDDDEEEGASPALKQEDSDDGNDEPMEGTGGPAYWTSLVHDGVAFPPEYEPHGVEPLFDGQPLPLSPTAEEIMTAFAVTEGQPLHTNPVFLRNVAAEFSRVAEEGHDAALSAVVAGLYLGQPGALLDASVSEAHKTRIRRSVQEFFDKLDTSPIFAWHLDRKEAQKGLTKEEKASKKAAADAIRARYGVAYFDGMVCPVGPAVIEPPGLFRPRGKHPKLGVWKHRVRPEDITLNLGEDAPVPPAPTGHSWGAIVHRRDVLWTATWRDTVMGSTKYVRVGQNTHFKAISDWAKFQNARVLNKHVHHVRKAYCEALASPAATRRECALATYIIDLLAIRAGTPKNTAVTADTVGACSLRVNNVDLAEADDGFVTLDFLGKDSVRYVNRTRFQARPLQVLRACVAGKGPEDPLFSHMSHADLCSFIRGLLPQEALEMGAHLTAKTFRTFNASYMLARLLSQYRDADGTVLHRRALYERANRDVAILCNHQRNVATSFDDQLGRIDEKLDSAKDKLEAAKREHYRVLIELHDRKAGFSGFSHRVLRDAKAAVAKVPRDVDLQVIFPPTAGSTRTRDGDAADATEAKSARSTASRARWADLKADGDAKLKTYEKAILRKVLSLSAQTQNAESQRAQKVESKNYATSTSRTNYLDPRVTVAWCRRTHTPLNKVFNRSLLLRFPWALETPSDWVF